MKKFGYFSYLCFATFALLEIVSRILIGDPAGGNPQEELGIKNKALKEYSVKQLDKNLPFVSTKNGGDCIQISKGFKWNNWWGYSNKRLDIDCAKNHFNSSKSFNVVFMGGSSMANEEAPNYLTHIDYYSTKDHKNVRSLNLAETGARHMNMLIRFIREVVPLKPNLVIFFDGYNEFNSIKYGGNPEDDFYFTAGAKDRLENPLSFFIQKMTSSSSFLNLSLIKTGLIKSSRYYNNSIGPKEINKASDYYFQDTKITKKLCEVHNIKCLFVIQPVVYFNPQISEHFSIIERFNKNFPQEEEIYYEGLSTILKSCDYCIDMTDALSGIKHSYIDTVHFAKNGSEVVGGLLSELIMEQIRKN